MEDQARRAVCRFLLEAQRHPAIGTQARLADRLSSYDRGYSVSRPTVSAWIRGAPGHNPNAWVLFAMALDLEMSLDQYVFGARDVARRLAELEGRVEEQRAYIVHVAEEINRRWADRGEPPISLPEAT